MQMSDVNTILNMGIVCKSWYNSSKRIEVLYHIYKIKMGQVLFICNQIPNIIETETKPKYNLNSTTLFLDPKEKQFKTELLDSFLETFTLIIDKFTIIQPFVLVNLNFESCKFQVYVELISILINYCKSILKFGDHYHFLFF